MFRSNSGYTGRTRTAASMGELLVCEGGKGGGKGGKKGKVGRRSKKSGRRK